MSRIIREQLINLILLALLILLIFMVWQFVLRPSDDREPSRSRMVRQEYFISQCPSTYPQRFFYDYV